jgi:hypothetical protein
MYLANSYRPDTSFATSTLLGSCQVLVINMLTLQFMFFAAFREFVT